MLDRPDPSAIADRAPVASAPRRGRSRVDPRIPASSPPGEDDVLRLVGQVYDASIGGEAWETVVTGLRDLLRSESAALFSAGHGVPAGAVHVEDDPRVIRPYYDHYHRISPLTPLVSQLPSRSAFTHQMVVPEAVYTRSEFYNDWLRPQGKHSSLNWLDAGDGSNRSYLCLWRQRWQPAWEPAALRVVGAVGLHLARALEIRRRLAAPGAPRSAAAAADLLAPQERACLAGVARGASSKQIARQLGLSMHTVDAYLASTRRKLKAASRSEAVAMALSVGLIDG
ncbi:response regulator transcription factor [Inquilinus sp. CA228]|uniref:response regulator transcription factor n=1 Tax=Inquilinus sp. CA228 TaxID=3455609 RepID=UPI003F8D340F